MSALSMQKRPRYLRIFHVMILYINFFSLYHTVVVIGFERSAYVVFEGQKTEVCVSILDRELSTDDHRNFTIMTNQLKQDPAES